MCRSFCVLSNLKSLTLWDYFSFPYWISLFLLFCTLEDNRFSGGGLFFFRVGNVYDLWYLRSSYKLSNHHPESVVLESCNVVDLEMIL